ncbi:hypothetical protein PHYBOEH_004310 [Phytophthora boehmeriae]|uniref:Uncharacterized protein n=1 Tax=Phytophthora boehmeriae TaxID=109152 RepID=A0A8T1X4U6_9STRA|nr:hypothetical protein PHYBOEH_004310 [Phytophthora boehmeriae]
MTRVGASRAVESYLRNFEGEKSRYQEILEITLCYGVQCLAQNFSLKGISCDELRSITGYDAARKRDFYVRNVSRPVSKGEAQRTPVELRAKPSHSWRDGEEAMADFHPPSTGAERESQMELEDAATGPDVQELIQSVTARGPRVKDAATEANLQSSMPSAAEQIPNETSKNAASRPNPQSPMISATEQYDARRELQDVRELRLGPKKVPLNEITKGAAALEIIDDFMKSPLMDKFGRDVPSTSSSLKHPIDDSTPQRRCQPDLFKEELYGTAALDNSFLGCQPPPELRRRKTQSTKPKRNYNGWLGDFGPLHTKTVRPEWNEADDDATDTDQRLHQNNFEWNFEHLSEEQHEPVGRTLRDATRTRAKPEQNDDEDSDGGIAQSIVDDASDVRSINSDPVFRWLKDAKF